MGNVIRIRDSITKEFVEIPALKGDKGEQGVQGMQGEKGNDGLNGGIQSTDLSSIAVKTQAEYDLLTGTSTDNILYLIRG